MPFIMGLLESTEWIKQTNKKTSDSYLYQQFRYPESNQRLERHSSKKVSIYLGKKKKKDLQEHKKGRCLMVLQVGERERTRMADQTKGTM